MRKQKPDKIWNNGMYKLDDEMGCDCCYMWYNGKCNAFGQRFDRGYCMSFDHKDKYIKHPIDQYEAYMREWN